MRMFQVDAFTDRVFGGNPAAVMILEDWLPEATMQAIAGENNLAETAFARPMEGGWDLRWYTPTVEVNFCGHATLATAHILATEFGVIGTMCFSTRVGQLRVTRSNKGYQLDLPVFPPESLDAFPDEISGIFQAAAKPFCNFENVFAELENEEAVRRFVPDLHRIGMLGRTGLVVTAAGESCDFVSRYFAPGAGIPEDPVTGSIHATLVPYWAQRLGKSLLSARQLSARGGKLECAREAVMVNKSLPTPMDSRARFGSEAEVSQRVGLVG